MNFIIREITDSDFEDLLLLFQEFADFQNSSEKMTNTLDQMDQDRNLFSGFIVKDEEGNLVAYLIFFYFFSTWSGKLLYIEDIYVRKQYQNKGIGSQLIRQTIDIAKREGCKKVRWQVSNWNTNAINFYESLGATIDKVEMNCNLDLK